MLDVNIKLVVIIGHRDSLLWALGDVEVDSY